MKFLDPLSTLQYMGGAIPTHIVMILYANRAYDDADQHVRHISPACLHTYPKYALDDIEAMQYVHIANVICLAVGNILTPGFCPKHGYFKSVL